jgi:zinc-dependent metalloproteinase lipoprotein
MIAISLKLLSNKAINILLFFCVFSNYLLIAQENRCANTHTPAYFAQTELVLQKALAEKKRQAQEDLQNPNARTERTETTYKIPVVFHIMYQEGEAIGTGSNISYEQILSQLTVLNEDFNRKNPDTTQTTSNFKSVAVSANIEFRMVINDPQGKKLPEMGVDRQKISKRIWDLNEFNRELAPNTIWNPNQYLNIWVIDSLTVDGSGYVGYGQFPDIDAADLAGIPSSIKLPSANAMTDGVVMDHGNTGAFRIIQTPQLARSRLNQGRTLTHEIGHFLGVRHIFSDNGICEDDFCGDTPIQASSTRLFTPCDLVIGRVSCGNTVMVQNFMDYSHDICMNIFTKDQVARMRTILEKSPRRKELLTSPVLTSTNEDNLSANFTIYPNPATDKIYLNNFNVLMLKSFILHNTLGQIVLQGNLQTTDTEILLPNIAKGLYFLQITTDKGKVVKKLLIE